MQFVSLDSYRWLLREMAAQITKRCHWVSQSYLRSFAADTDQKRIWRLSKSEGEEELKLIEKVAVRFYLYAPKGPDGKRDDTLEKKLANLENFLGGPLWRAVCNDFPDFGWEPLRRMVALLVATTYARNPLQFESWKEQHRQIVNQAHQCKSLPTQVVIGGKEYEIDPSGWTEFRRASEEDMKREWNQFVGTSAHIAELFMRMRWAVLCCEQPVFVTSDNPVQIVHPSLKFRGLNDRDSAVIFPLSPTRILLMDHRQHEQQNAFYPLQHNPAAENSLAWRGSIEHLFSSRNPHNVCAEMAADADYRGFP